MEIHKYLFLNIFFILVGVLLSAAAYAGENEWKALNDQVMPQLQSGAFKQAEQLARDAMAEAEKTFGTAHQNTAVSLSTLALVLRLQQRFEASETFYRRALAIRDKVLGAAHPKLVKSIHECFDVEGYFVFV